MGYKLQYRLCFIFFIIFSLYAVVVLRYDWYDDFFETLDNQSVKQYRLLQIWVQGDRRDHCVPIGGDEHSFNAWRAAVTTLLKKAQTRSDKLVFELELVLDHSTLEKHKNLFDNWEANFPGMVKLTSIQTLKKTYDRMGKAFDQCDYGIPALCSDLVRATHLHQDFDINVYIDIDTFLYHMSHQYHPYMPSRWTGIRSNCSLGALAIDQHIGFSYELKNAMAKFVTNNDLLVDRGTDLLWSKIKARLQEQVDSYDAMLTFITQRSYFADADHNSYLAWLQQKIDWAKTHPDHNFNQIPFVILLAGPSFWRQLYLEELAYGYELPFITSEGSWMNKTGSVYGAVSYNFLKNIFKTDVAISLIRFTFMSHDYQYFLKRNVPWTDALKDEIKDLWGNLSKQDQQIARLVLKAPADWLLEG